MLFLRQEQGLSWLTKARWALVLVASAEMEDIYAALGEELAREEQVVSTFFSLYMIVSRKCLPFKGPFHEGLLPAEGRLRGRGSFPTDEIRLSIPISSKLLPDG